MLNTRSDYLVVLVGTYNRLELLKRTLDSIASGTSYSHEVIVIDAGSTDGTVEYLRGHAGITPVFQGELVGQARAYNAVWREIESRYTCWLSDDTEITPRSLDLAVSILEAEPSIGMVGLKMRDVVGPLKDVEYLGAVSEYGIMNCNHGVLPLSLLRSVGFFNESYYTYTIDPDPTASVLSTGEKVVRTRQVAVLHYRTEADPGRSRRNGGGRSRVDGLAVYRRKFRFLGRWYKTNPFQKTWRQLVYHVAPSYSQTGSGGMAFLSGTFTRPWSLGSSPFQTSGETGSGRTILSNGSR